MRNLDPRRAKWIRVRMGLLCGIMGVALGGVVSSAWRVQIEDGDAWRDTAEKQRQRRMHIEPKRGSIKDRSGAPLAVSIEVPSVSVDVAELLKGVDGPAAQQAALRDASVRLATVLSLDANEVLGKLSQRRRFVWLPGTPAHCLSFRRARRSPPPPPRSGDAPAPTRPPPALGACPRF